MTDITYVLAAIPGVDEGRYRGNLAQHDNLDLSTVNSLDDARQSLAESDHRIDVFVVDSRLGDTHTLISDLRQGYPRLLIILVDEEADFGLPGQADEFTNDPFKEDDLVKKINKLLFERRQVTLRSDSLPAVREISKNLRTATGLGGKQQAAVDTILNMEFDYVAYYHLDGNQLVLKAQSGPRPILAVAPKQASGDDIMTWVMQNAQSRIASYGDELNHPLVAKGRLGAVACLPVMFDEVLYGVITACRERPNSIAQDNIMMLELVGAQLAMATSKEIR